MKKLRCPHCHSLITKPGPKGTVEAGKYDQRKQRHEVEEEVRQIACTKCDKRFYIEIEKT